MGFCDNMKDDLPEANFAERFFFLRPLCQENKTPSLSLAASQTIWKMLKVRAGSRKLKGIAAISGAIRGLSVEL